jgi:hypothetical protein
LDAPEIDPVGQVLREDAATAKGKVVKEAGAELTDLDVTALKKAGVKQIRIKAVASTKIDYLSADREESVSIAQANTEIDEHNRIVPENVVVRVGGGHRFPVIPAEQVNYMDVSPKQVVSVATALIPFLEHDDANRALMGGEHAAPGGAAGSAAVADRRHGRRAPGRERLWPGGCRTPQRNDRLGQRPSGRHHRRRWHGPLVPAPKVRPLEPGHVHQPAPERGEGGAGGGR